MSSGWASVLAVALAAAAAGLAPRSPGSDLGRGRSAAGQLRAGRGRRVSLTSTSNLVPAVVGAVLVVLTRSLVLAAAGAVAVTGVHRVVAGGAQRRRDDRDREAAMALVGGLAAELRAGAAPRPALVAAVEAINTAAPWTRPVLAAARSPTGDPALALALAAQAPGCAVCADLAAVWRVVETSGGALAGAATRLAATARAETDVRRELDAAVAGPRATASLLSALPLGGIVLGRGLGADPLAFLLGAGPGRWCLLAGVVLVAAGARWTDAIVRRAGQG